MNYAKKSTADLTHQTPFCKSLPGVPAAWTPSYFHTFSTCPRKFYYEKLEGWQSKGSVAMRFGSEFHAGVEDYKRFITKGLKHEDAVLATVKSLWARVYPWDSQGDTARSIECLLRAIVWFVDSEENSHLTPLILANGEPALELDWELQFPLISPDGHPYILRSHFDEICYSKEDEEFIVTKERKTTKTTLSHSYFAQFKPDTQTAAYSLAGKVVFAFRSLHIIIEAVQTMVEGTRFGTHLVSYSEDELEEFLTDCQLMISMAEHYAKIGYWPMNRSSCDARGGCHFRDVCSRSPSVRQVILESDFLKAPSNWEISGFQNLLSYLTPNAE